MEIDKSNGYLQPNQDSKVYLGSVPTATTLKAISKELSPYQKQLNLLKKKKKKDLHNNRLIRKELTVQDIPLSPFVQISSTRSFFLVGDVLVVLDFRDSALDRTVPAPINNFKRIDSVKIHNEYRFIEASLSYRKPTLKYFQPIADQICNQPDQDAHEFGRLLLKYQEYCFNVHEVQKSRSGGTTIEDPYQQDRKFNNASEIENMFRHSSFNCEFQYNQNPQCSLTCNGDKFNSENDMNNPFMTPISSMDSLKQEYMKNFNQEGFVYAIEFGYNLETQEFQLKSYLFSEPFLALMGASLDQYCRHLLRFGLTDFLDARSQLKFGISQLRETLLSFEQQPKLSQTPQEPIEVNLITLDNITIGATLHCQIVSPHSQQQVIQSQMLVVVNCEIDSKSLEKVLCIRSQAQEQESNIIEEVGFSFDYLMLAEILKEKDYPVDPAAQHIIPKMTEIMSEKEGVL